MAPPFTQNKQSAWQRNVIFWNIVSSCANFRPRRRYRVLVPLLLLGISIYRFCLRPPNQAHQTTWDIVVASGQQQSSNSNNVLVAQYTDSLVEKHGSLMEISHGPNLHYAERHGYDYGLLRGVALYPIRPLEWILGTTPSASRAAYNKIQVVLNAQKGQMYDFLFLLDADAVVYNQSRSVMEVVGNVQAALKTTHSQPILIAHQNGDNDDPWNINNGVTVWNLRHPQLTHLLRAWYWRCVRRILWGLVDKDQKPLQRILQQHPEWVASPPDQSFALGRHGTFVRHHIRVRGNVWTPGEVDAKRLEQLRASAAYAMNSTTTTWAG